MSKCFMSALLVVMLSACTGSRWVRKHDSRFSPDDSIFIDRTLAVYDSFVRARVGHELPLDEAYRHFYAENIPKLQTAGDIGIYYVPDSTFAYQWTSDFVGGWLHNSFVEPRYSSPQKQWKHTIPQWPGGWQFRINYTGLERLGKIISRNNPFWKDIVSGIMAGGDFGPIYYPTIIRMNEKINFKDKHERFLAVIGFMNGCFYHRDFNLVADVCRNDSLKAKNEQWR